MVQVVQVVYTYNGEVRIFQTWEAWEEKTINMYDNAISEYPDCKLLKIFRKDTEKELKIIRYKLGHI